MTRNCLPALSVCGCWWWCEVSERPCEGLTTGPGQQQPASSRVKQLGPLPAPAPACSMDRVFIASPLTGPGASSLPSLYTAEDSKFQHSQLKTLPCSKFFHVLLITRYKIHRSMVVFQQVQCGAAWPLCSTERWKPKRIRE